MAADRLEWLAHAQAELVGAMLLGLPPLCWRWYRQKRRAAALVAGLAWVGLAGDIAYLSIKGEFQPLAWTSKLITIRVPLGWALLAVVLLVVAILAAAKLLRARTSTPQEVQESAERPSGSAVFVPPPSALAGRYDGPVRLSERMRTMGFTSEEGPTIWQGASAFERELLDSLYGSQRVFASETDLKRRYASLGLPRLRATLQKLSDEGLITADQRYDGPHPSAGWTLTERGKSLMAWKELKGGDLVAPDRDPVTGLGSRKSLDLDLPAAVARALSARSPLALVMLDVDHFKKVNDTHGHQKGDEVLAGIAERLQTVMTGKGSAYRYGGEEMTLLLPNHSLAEALAVAERTRLTVGVTPLADVSVTISLGIAILPDHATDKDGLLRAADDALYDAKKRGRNLVRYSGEPEPQAPHSREPQRRVPDPSGLTEEQLVVVFRKEVLHGRKIVCPTDGAPFKVIDVTNSDSVGREFLITCTDCGLTATLSGPSGR